MDRDALVRSVKKAVQEKRGCHHAHCKDCEDIARAALAVAEPVVRADERHACLNVAHRWTRGGHSATAHGIILGIEERAGGTP